MRICFDREKPRRGGLFASTARDLAVELQKLGLAKGGPYPKSKSDFARLQNKPIRITPAGKELLGRCEEDAAAGFDALFEHMFAAHRYVRDYARVLHNEKLLLAPVLTSFKDHVAPDYASAPTLRNDVMLGHFRTSALIESVSNRVGRLLRPDERNRIETDIEEMLAQARVSVTAEEPTVFAKAILSRLNDIVVPAVFGTHGLGFDFRTHRAIWSLGEEFRVWWSTTAHPSYAGTIVFSTASLRLTAEGEKLRGIDFDASLSKLRETFLPRLHQAYLSLQKVTQNTLVAAPELRAVFCLENKCQPSTFDALFDQQYARDDTPYEVHTEIQQQRPRHEKPLRAGNRNVGLVFVSKK
ncbi:MAG TPA: hypothetical protein VEX43_04160 [Chthoniobacterales bacterium]|nr:hypothetical protein [Chthoniobacterales bacterium]